jgi:hypothetical protein
MRDLVTTDRRIALLLGLVALVAFGPIVAADTAQPASRYSLTAALAEHHTVDIGRYREFLGVDRAVYRGHLRSDKPPGQPLLAVPPYLVGRALGADSATHVHIRGDLGLWWSTFWTATIPFAALLALMFLACARFASRRAALGVTLAFGVSTMLLPFSVNLFGHALATLVGFAGWLLIEGDRVSPRRAAATGFLGGVAVLTEYDSGIVLVVLAAYLLVRHRARIGWFVVGAAAPLGVLAWYQAAAFGAPWHTPSAYFAGTINGSTEGGYTIPSPRDLMAVLFGGRGLAYGAPVALVGLAAALWLLKIGNGAARRHAVVALAVTIPYVVLCAGWSGFALLEDPGPRYLIPALPFLAVPLVVLWDKLWRPVALAAVWGALVSVPAAFTFILVTREEHLFPDMLRRVTDGNFAPTLWSMAFGRFGVVAYAASVVVAVCSFVRLVVPAIGRRTDVRSAVSEALPSRR